MHVERVRERSRQCSCSGIWSAPWTRARRLSRSQQRCSHKTRAEDRPPRSRLPWQEQVKGASRADFALESNEPAPPFDDSIDACEAEGRLGPLWLVGEDGFEDAGPGLGVHAGAGVPDREV